MSGRAFEKKIKAVTTNVKEISTKIKPEPVYVKTETSTSNKRKLWRLNNFMFLIHATFCTTTLVIGKLLLLPPIYKLNFSVNQFSLGNYSNYTVAQMNEMDPNWDNDLNNFLDIQTIPRDIGLPMTWLVALFFFLSRSNFLKYFWA